MQVNTQNDQKQGVKFNDPDQLIREHEVAEYLCCSVRTLQKWRVSGEGPKFVRLGSSIRYSHRSLTDFINRQTIGSTSEQVSS